MQQSDTHLLVVRCETKLMIRKEDSSPCEQRMLGDQMVVKTQVGRSREEGNGYWNSSGTRPADSW